MQLNGILNILKPPGMTSHDVVSVVRKKLNMKKVGHTGTLDPNAAGVLPICIGQATKISQFLLDGKKKYRAELTLGIETNTEDMDGEVLHQREVTSTPEEIREAIFSFIGEYKQIPPMYSAIKINGKKLYELARQGMEVERAERAVTIYHIEIIEIFKEKVIFDVLCSKGTYIRTLCKDIGKTLGCGGVMSFLLRTESSDFSLDTAITIEELQALENVEDILLPMDYPLQHMPKAIVKSSYSKQVLNGNRIYSNYLMDGIHEALGQEVCVYLEQEFVGFGIVRNEDHHQKYIKILRLLFEKE